MPEVEVTEQSQEPEESHDGFIRVDKHQKDVNVQHKKFRDEERGRVKAEERADSVQKELDDLNAKNATVEIPPVPDQHSETYAADVVTRDEAIRKQADQDAVFDVVFYCRIQCVYPFPEYQYVHQLNHRTAIHRRLI